MVASYYCVSTTTSLMGRHINHKPTLLFIKKNIWGDIFALVKKHIFAAFGFLCNFVIYSQENKIAILVVLMRYQQAL